MILLLFALNWGGMALGLEDQHPMISHYVMVIFIGFFGSFVQEPSKAAPSEQPDTEKGEPEPDGEA